MDLRAACQRVVRGGASPLKAFSLFREVRKLEPLAFEVYAKAPPLPMQLVSPRTAEPSPNSREDPMLRLQDYERVLLGQLRFLGEDCMVEPPVFEWDGTVVNFLDMLDFARNLLKTLESRVTAQLNDVASGGGVFAMRIPHVRTIERLNRLRESIEEIEIIARKLIRSPRSLNN